MTIEYNSGNIFDATTDIIVNPINCKGVMGAGLALTFKNKFPEMFKEYKKKCHNEELKIGNIYLYKLPEKYLRSYNFKAIINFPTKDDYRQKSQLDYIIKGMETLIRELSSLSDIYTSISMPRLGCGLGGLDWNIVKNEIREWWNLLTDQYENWKLVIYE